MELFLFFFLHFIDIKTSVLFYFRTLINGDKEAGFSIFWADDGLDTGPILLQESCPVEENDTVDTLYSKFLYPRGIQAMVGNYYL